MMYYFCIFLFVLTQYSRAYLKNGDRKVTRLVDINKIYASADSTDTVSRSYFYKYNKNQKIQIHYERKGNDNNPVLLFIPGFGVGTYHYNNQFENLSDKFCIYSLDLLGQGKSWPITSINENDNFTYDINSWRDQIIDFVETIVKKPVHICGNSLGGFLSIACASYNPKLFKSITLLNSTPFWAFRTENFITKFIWNGRLPAPKSYLSFGSSYFNLLKNANTIKSMLSLVYYNKNSISDQLISNIIDSASNAYGAEAFTSILFSSKYHMDFDQMLDLLKGTIHICMIYGKDDPWVNPFWGNAAFNKLERNIPYFQLHSTGHCPADESPSTVNAILSEYINCIEMNNTMIVKSSKVFEELKSKFDKKYIQEQTHQVYINIIQ